MIQAPFLTFPELWSWRMIVTQLPAFSGNVIYICMYLCVYIYVYMYIHIYMCIHIDI